MAAPRRGLDASYIDRQHFFEEGVIRLYNQQETCAICIDAQVHLMRVRACGHIFCQECLISWCNVNERATCPMCRAPFWSLADQPPATVMADVEQQVLGFLSGAVDMIAAAMHDELDNYGFRADIRAVNRGVSRASWVVQHAATLTSTSDPNDRQLEAAIGLAAMHEMLPMWFRVMSGGEPLNFGHQRQWSSIIETVWATLINGWNSIAETGESPDQLEDRVFSAIRGHMVDLSEDPDLHDLAASDYFMREADYDGESEDDQPSAGQLLRRTMLQLAMGHIASFVDTTEWALATGQPPNNAAGVVLVMELEQEQEEVMLERDR